VDQVGQTPSQTGPGAGWPAGQVLCWFGPRLRGHVSTREEKGRDGGERQWKLFHLANRHLVSYRLAQVAEASQQPYKYLPMLEIRTRTPLHGNSTCKALILSVVARSSLVGRVARLCELEGLPACQEPSS
jgi:hypothetical protein